MKQEQTEFTQSKNETINLTAGNDENAGDNRILEILNPLKSINIYPDLHSFYNFKELKNSVETLLSLSLNRTRLTTT